MQWQNSKVFAILGLLREYDAKSKGLNSGGAPDGELLREDFKETVHRLVKERTDATTAQILMEHDIAGEQLDAIAERLGLSYQAMCTKRRIALLRLAKYEDLRELY